MIDHIVAVFLGTFIGLMVLIGLAEVCSLYVQWKIIKKLDLLDQLLKTKHDNAFVNEQNQEKADFYAELLTLLREARHL